MHTSCHSVLQIGMHRAGAPEHSQSLRKTLWRFKKDTDKREQKRMKSIYMPQKIYRKTDLYRYILFMPKKKILLFLLAASEFLIVIYATYDILALNLIKTNPKSNSFYC